MDTNVSTVDAYIHLFPSDIQAKLTAVRNTIQSIVPEAVEVIKYAMPTYVLHGNLVHFAAFKQHIGFYPTPNAIVAFQEELSKYKGAKGSVQFPLDEPLPLELIAKIVEFRLKENIEKAAAKKKK